MRHHVPTRALQDKVLAAAFRVLRPGGTFLGSDSLPRDALHQFHEGDTYNPGRAGPVPHPATLDRPPPRSPCTSRTTWSSPPGRRTRLTHALRGVQLPQGGHRPARLPPPPRSRRCWPRTPSARAPTGNRIAGPPYPGGPQQPVQEPAGRTDRLPARPPGTSRLRGDRPRLRRRYTRVPGPAAGGRAGRLPPGQRGTGRRHLGARRRDLLDPARHSWLNGRAAVAADRRPRLLDPPGICDRLPGPRPGRAGGRDAGAGPGHGPLPGRAGEQRRAWPGYNLSVRPGPGRPSRTRRPGRWPKPSRRTLDLRANARATPTWRSCAQPAPDDEAAGSLAGSGTRRKELRVLRHRLPRS